MYWERKINRNFEFKELDDNKYCMYAVLKLSGGALIWYEGLKTRRRRAGKEKITSWESLKWKLQKRYVPVYHRMTNYRRMEDLKQGKIK